ncbi:MAG: radical SAM protein, partial [bacterium]|nr:radical SAM protein [bacterium]
MTIIVLTGSSCNISCNYCYVTASRQSIKKMPFEKIPDLIKNCAIGFDRVEFCWHGGEPLLAGKEFYRAVVAAQKQESEKRGIVFRNGIQSNGILVDEEWISFFKANDFGLGISFDAPPDTHNLHRNNTAEKVLEVFSLMRRLEFHCGMICVVSKHNVGKAEEIFEFFRQQEASSYSFLPLKSVPMPLLPG